MASTRFVGKPKKMKQMRWVGGVSLIGLGLLMAVGVSKAKLPPNPVVTALTIGISVILPIATGTRLLYSPARRSQPSLGPEKAALRARTLQAEMIKLAIAQGGRLTVVEVVAALGIDAQTATQQLTALTHQQIAELEMTESGLMVYRFHDIQSLPEKYDSKRIADI